jgi:hypothetical protein
MYWIQRLLFNRVNLYRYITLHLTLNTHGDGLDVSVGHLTWQEQYRLLQRSMERTSRAAAMREKTAMALFLAAEVCFCTS